MSTVLGIRESFLLALFCASMYSACQGGHDKAQGTTSRLASIQIGMNYVEVLQQIGFPDTIIHVGITLDEWGSQTKIDEWWYGPDEVIVLINDTVHSIDRNPRATYDKIWRIIDSAKAASR